jgi:hypothetical protein
VSSQCRPREDVQILHAVEQHVEIKADKVVSDNDVRINLGIREAKLNHRDEAYALQFIKEVI